MTHEAKAGSAAASGQGSVTRCFAAGGIISGKGQIIRKNGEVVDFELTSNPLTAEQAENLSEKHSMSEEQ